MARYFKTGPGEYGAGDVFAGISMPQLRRVVRAHRDLALPDVLALLADPVHEHRMVAVLLLADQYTRADRAGDRAGCEQLADGLSGQRRGDQQLGPGGRVAPSTSSARGGGRKVPRGGVPGCVWRARSRCGRGGLPSCRRSTTSSVGDSGPALEVCALLLGDREDLIHKATGWMLREVGKRVGRDDLLGFLDAHAAVMPRTMLRYAIEHLSPEVRAHYLGAARRADRLA